MKTDADSSASSESISVSLHVVASSVIYFQLRGSLTYPVVSLNTLFETEFMLDEAIRVELLRVLEEVMVHKDAPTSTLQHVSYE